MDEKTRVKQALQTPLVLDQVWQPIATAWFDKWKAYVNYDAVEVVKKVKGLRPGPVDNGTLEGEYCGELRRDLVAERDYVLLPETTADLLIQRYGGGPKFLRKVNVPDDSDDRSLGVDLWPVYVNLYLCDRSHPTPLEPKMEAHYYYPSCMKLPEAVKDAARSAFSVDDTNTPTRYWLKTRPAPGLVWVWSCTGMGRRLTNDMVDWNIGWHVVGSAEMSRRMKDIRGSDVHACVELIVEVAPFRDPTPSDWPRFHLLEAWKQDIRMGDMIDARDAEGHFDAATVVHVNVAGDLVVRYWTGGDDEWILAGDFDRRIAPLHSHSSDTSKLTADMTAPSTLATRKRSRDMPPATSDDDDGCTEDNRDAGRKAKTQCLEGHCGSGETPSRSGSSSGSGRGSGSGSGSGSGTGTGTGSGTKTPPLTANDVKVAADVLWDAHLRRALQAYSIDPPRVDAVLQVLREEAVSSLAVWQALTPVELSSLLEAHRETFPVGLRTAMRLVHRAAPTL